MAEDHQDPTEPKEVAYVEVRQLSTDMNKLLDRWSYEDVNTFLDAAESGDLDEDAVADAKELTRMQDRLKKLMRIIQDLS